MNNNFDELEDIFEEETELEIKPNINIDLLTQYINDPSLLERDINEGMKVVIDGDGRLQKVEDRS